MCSSPVRYFVTCLVILQLLPLLICSCATNNKPAEFYYSIPTVSYLRECPAYDCQVVAEIYSTDKVKFLAKSDTGWWQVQSTRDEKIGWTQRDLLSEIPLIARNYYVTVEALPLRDTPGEDIVSRKLLSYGDEVQKIAEREGWWRVLAGKDKAIGWIQAKMVSETPPRNPNKPEKPAESAESPRPPQAAYYFVAANSVNLYLIPTIPSQVVKVLTLNDKVEKISQAGSQWFKVRFLITGAEGWALARYFKDSPVAEKKQIVTDKKRSPKKTSSSKQKTPTPDLTNVEPEGM
jgi:uncharacterized protein YgiM (DUF1202 family)